MTMTLTGTGGLYTRLGVIFSSIGSVNKFLASGDIDAGGLDSVGALVAKIRAQFLASLQYTLETPQALYTTQAGALTALDNYKRSMRDLAENVLIETANVDVTLVNKTASGAIGELQTQMVGSGTVYSSDNDLDAATVTATITATSTNTGTGKLICSVIRPDGRTHELVLAETMEAFCTTDGQVGGTAGSETFSINGEPSISDTLAYNWPAGSAISQTLTSIDATLDASGNLLTNSCFDAVNDLANVPDQWHLGSVGTLGTDIFAEASIIYGSSGKAVKFLGVGGATLPEIYQTFNDSGGTSSTLKPDTVYAVNFFAKDSGAGLTGGVMAVSLVDGSNAVINDDAATANTVSVAYSTTSATYAAVNGFFRTPRVMPTSVKIRVKMTTTPTSGESMYIDSLAMCEAVDLYGNGQGPWAALFSGSTNWIKGDKITAAFANNRAGGFQDYFDRCFGMRALGYQLPSDTAGTETIADTLISSLETVDDRPQVVSIIAPINLNNATTLSTAVDMTVYQMAMFVITLGVIDTTVDMKLKESATSGGSYTDISGKAITQLAGTDDGKQAIIFVRATELGTGKYFVKASVTVGNGTSSLGAVVGIGLRPFAGYDTANDSSTVAEIIGS